MVLKPGDYDFLSSMSAIWSIVIGALLATLGGLAGSQLEWHFERNRRERDAALLFAEVFSALKLLLELAADSMKVGDPYGPITLRMLRSARREIDIYERNRESLVSLRDAELRAKIHAAILRLAMPLDGIFDSCQAIETLELQLKTPNLPQQTRQELDSRIASISEARKTGFEFILETKNNQLTDAVVGLARRARSSHGAIDRVVNAQS
jgi:hypothetical protein